MENIREDPYIEQLRFIASKLNSKIYLVGGAIRDIFLNRQANDYDFVVFGNLKRLAKEVSSRFLCKYILYEKKLKTYRVFCRAKTIDLSEPRAQTIEEDLKKRDFTINSMAVDLDSLKLIDPLGGKKDLKKGIIRINSDKAIDDDPLRILRGFRLAATFRFDIEAQTVTLFRDKVKLLKKISPERITEELKLLFLLNETFTYLLIMDRVGVIDTLFEDLTLTNACIQSSKHLFDVKTHSLSVYNYIEWALNRLERVIGKSFKKYLIHYTMEKETLLVAFKLAALFHDAAKPFCKIVVDGNVKFPMHEIESAKLFEKYAKIYPFGRKISKLTKFFIEKHIEPANLYKAWSLNELEELNKVNFFINYGENGIDLLIFALADTLAKGKISASKREVYIMFLQEMADYYYSIEKKLKEKPILPAEEILKLYPSLDKKKLKPILTNIKKLQIANAIKSKEEAISIVKKMI